MLINNDCLIALKGLPENSIDSLITDPPAGISFMRKEWDKGNNFIPAMTEIFQEVLRCLKPGAHGLVWALPKTSHWTATALENAGFEIRDVVTHLFGSGFPKSHDLSKAIDKTLGEKREIVGTIKGPGTEQMQVREGAQQRFTNEHPLVSSEPLSDESKHWQGWGTALKPASEHWILVRKPLSEKTIAANVLKHGTGGINIDACRIGIELVESGRNGRNECVSWEGGALKETPKVFKQGRFPANLVLDEEAAKMLDEQSGVSKSEGGTKTGLNESKFGQTNGKNIKYFNYGDRGGASRFFKCFSNGNENDINNECDQKFSKNVEPVKYNSDQEDQLLNSAQEAVKTFFKNDLRLNHFLDSIPDSERCILIQNLASLVENKESIDTIEIIQSLLKLSGFARHVTDENTNSESQRKNNVPTRFLYQAKASKKDRNEGLEGMPEKELARSCSAQAGNEHEGSGFNKIQITKNHHPTVKSTKLMEYLITLITPPNGVVLDPFMGSGSTGKAAKNLGFKFIGIEKEKEYFEIAEKRIG